MHNPPRLPIEWTVVSVFLLDIHYLMVLWLNKYGMLRILVIAVICFSEAVLYVELSLALV